MYDELDSDKMNWKQAIDIGHIDLEYEWYLHGGGKRCAVSGKYNNEYVGGEIAADIQDKQYESEVIDRIM